MLRRKPVSIFGPSIEGATPYIAYEMPSQGCAAATHDGNYYNVSEMGRRRHDLQFDDDMGWFAKVLHWIGAAIILVVLARCSKAGSGIFRELTPSPNNIGRDRAGRLQDIKTRHGNES